MDLEPTPPPPPPDQAITQALHDVATIARMLEGGIAQQTDLLPGSVTKMAATAAEVLNNAAERLAGALAQMRARPPRPPAPVERAKPPKRGKAASAQKRPETPAPTKPPTPAVVARAPQAANGAAPGPAAAPSKGAV